MHLWEPTSASLLAARTLVAAAAGLCVKDPTVMSDCMACGGLSLIWKLLQICFSHDKVWLEYSCCLDRSFIGERDFASQVLEGIVVELLPLHTRKLKGPLHCSTDFTSLHIQAGRCADAHAGRAKIYQGFRHLP